MQKGSSAHMVSELVAPLKPLPVFVPPSSWEPVSYPPFAPGACNKQGKRLLAAHYSWGGGASHGEKA